MPNIIEQQDLLKGLPDNRLALLMQNPVADIPPFLVAAEAQRRQAIRQQFSGDAGKESVVDTLTKQLANVPQNVQAPMQKPPQMPPPQQMAPQGGIGAIQQGMAGGGSVRRFAGGTLVVPTVDSGTADYFQDPMGTPSTASEAGSFTNPFSGLGDLITRGLQALPHSPVPRWQTEEEAKRRWNEEHNSGMTSYEAQKEILTLKNRIPPKKEAIPRDPSNGTRDTSNENKSNAEYENYRKRIEELYGAEEPSNWENAQKWFAMAAQIMNPDVNLTQGLINAGAVYSGAEAEQAQARRAGKRDLAEALLKYDMGVTEDERASAAAAVKAKTDIATGQLDDLYRQMSDAQRRMDDIQMEVTKGNIDQTSADAEKKKISSSVENIGRRISAYESYLQGQYGFSTIPTVNIAKGALEY